MRDETTLRDLFTEELQDILHGERQLVKALPKMAKAATSPELREALQNHLAETEEHVSRLEQAFELIDETVKTKVCAGLQGIIEEGSDVIKEHDKSPALDAAIIAGGQRAEHYEIAVYGTLMAWARALGHDDVAALLSDTLEEEKAADEKLTELAEAGINQAAQSSQSGEDEEAEEGETDEEDEEMAAAGSSASKGRSRSSSTSNSRGQAQRARGRSQRS
ncbi:MAG TPA: ferritin-like domain-containing protein [Vicinamibacterales bacterium]|nr:ferritin-like domain-containing protein [Vicinamibacterales bacterium]